MVAMDPSEPGRRQIPLIEIAGEDGDLGFLQHLLDGRRIPRRDGDQAVRCDRVRQTVPIRAFEGRFGVDHHHSFGHASPPFLSDGPQPAPAFALNYE